MPGAGTVFVCALRWSEPSRFSPISSATQTEAAPSVRGDELPAVRLPVGPRSNTVGNEANFSSVLSGRGRTSLSTPKAGWTRSRKNPAGAPVAAR